jgi:hypothetical protein
MRALSSYIEMYSYAVLSITLPLSLTPICTSIDQRFLAGLWNLIGSLNVASEMQQMYFDFLKNKFSLSVLSFVAQSLREFERKARNRSTRSLCSAFLGTEWFDHVGSIEIEKHLEPIQNASLCFRWMLKKKLLGIGSADIAWAWQLDTQTNSRRSETQLHVSRLRSLNKHSVRYRIFRSSLDEQSSQCPQIRP